MGNLSHFDEQGASRMVDVSSKDVTLRAARATARMRLEPATLARVRDRDLEKGDVLEVARLAGILAAKKTGDLIPLCHPLAIDSVSILFDFPSDQTIAIEATVRVSGRTGVEMEALTAVSLTALTIYDMCKSIDRSIVIEQIQLEEKSGGRSGHFVRRPATTTKPVLTGSVPTGPVPTGPVPAGSGHGSVGINDSKDVR